MRRYITLDRMEQILSKALSMGLARKGELAHRWTWDVSASCRRPCDVQLVARTEYKGRAHYRVHPVEARTVMLDMQVPCRRCDECRVRKSRHWMLRAEAECRHWPRTWLGTLTLSPDNHYLMKLRASAHLDRNGIRFEDLDEAEQFQLRCAEIGKELQLYQKRIRKAVSGKIRLLAVYERHKTGLPHMHLLVHECDALAPVRKAMLQSQWRLGFTNFKLVDKLNPRSGSYVCKYIAKETLTRIRASQNYGLNRETDLFDRDVFIENNPWEKCDLRKRSIF